MRKAGLLIAAALGGCAAPPLVDMTDVNPVVYQRDFDQCQVEAQTVEPAGPIVAGAIIGASFGMGLATVITAVPTTSAAVGYGAASGGAAGAGASAATGTPVALPPPAPRQSLADCLAAHGYKVIAAAAK